MADTGIELILARRSIRKYGGEPVSEADVQTLLEAAMAAPSAANRQPWHFITVADRATLARLAEPHPYAKMLPEAALCVVVCGDSAKSPQYWVQDCAAATENLLLAATALGLGAVWLGVYPDEGRVAAVRETLAIPEPCVPFNMISIGHPAEQKEPRTQFDAARVHAARW
jgi:nitroreductase